MFLRNLLILLALIAMSTAYGSGSGSPIPYRTKFERQNNPNYKGSHVFKTGEQVSATFFAETCNGLLTLTVAEGVPGGVGDIRHSDSFNITDPTASDVEKAHDWRGLTFEGVVEIIEPIVENGITSNMFPYKARILSLLPPASPMNPDLNRIQRMSRGQQIYLQGLVVDLQNEYIVVRFFDTEYRVALTGGIPQIDDDLSGTINNLDGKERVMVGDRVQLKAFVHENGSLYAHWCRSCLLDEPSQARKAEYDAERSNARNLLSQMTSSIQEQSWARYRNAFASFSKLKLTADELEQDGRIWETVPEKERPIRLRKNERYTIESLNKMFAVDFDAMTTLDFKHFFNRWANLEVKHVLMTTQDESYLFRLMNKINLPKEFFMKMAQISVTTRVEYFVDKAKHGLHYDHKLDWNQTYNLEQSLSYLSYAEDFASLSFLLQTFQKLVDLEIQQWGFTEMHIYYCADAIERLFENVRKKDDVAKRLPQLLPLAEQIYLSLSRIRRAKASGTVVIIGMPPLRDLTQPYQDQNLRFANEMAKLYQIIQKMGAGSSSN